MFLLATITFLLLQGVLGGSETVNDSHGNLRSLEDKVPSFSCAQQYGCIDITLEQAIDATCLGPGVCGYKVCFVYKGGPGCPNFFEHVGRNFDLIPGDINSDYCYGGGGLNGIPFPVCQRDTPSTFGGTPGTKRCVIVPGSIPGPPPINVIVPRFVRFSLDAGSEVCEPVNSPATFPKTYGSTPVTWKCGRNPDNAPILETMDCTGDGGIPSLTNLEECVWELELPVPDVTPPTIPGLGDKTVQCESLIPAVSTYAATDNIDVNPSETVKSSVESPVPRRCLDDYVLTRTWEAKDGCGLVFTATEKITVKDTTKPTFNNAPPPTKSIACGENYPIPILTASDNCGRTVTVSQPSSSFPCGTVVSLNWVATDECGNQASTSQTVTVGAAPTPPTPTPPAPTPIATTPAPAPASSGFCFSGENTVHVRDKGTISMESLEVGDFVHDGDTFSRVWSLMHMDRDVEAEYLQIQLDALKSPLEITAEHFVLTMNHQPVRAGDVKVGDMLGEGLVTAIDFVKRHGLYAPATESGKLMVSGVPASCYINLLDGVAPSIQASLMHAALAPLRSACRSDFSMCKNEKHTEEGYSTNLTHLIGLGRVLADGNSFVQKFVIALYLPVLLAFNALQMFFAHGTIAALLVGVVVIAKKAAKVKSA